ncbi:DEAD/DEAH box helicase [Anianabacter salinae]|uniref:DEAD/DEAH box helicase n=1 Tax=Anianabacter salinae TaxID=2851023 RepID=UPI00225E6604|nr:DEAD/DEAH box helicase [Anianabacter salinae]MBV0911454.1 DEAD/DEAH box helicase [Anianabacter salinae]
MTKFTELGLDPKVVQAVTEAGYETPTPIQAGAIPAALQGQDVLGIAQTGTGKTASFVLPMITLLAKGRARARMPRSLVLCPTRELAAQVAENFDTYTKHLKLTKALLIGGVSFKEQDQLIDRGVDVLIATPGRLLDHFERGKLLLTGVQIMVVDEADRMLDMGFIPDIERIFSLTPFTRQTLFFSATMAPEIERITNTFLSNPKKVEVARQATASETIAQEVIELKASRRDTAAAMKREALRATIEREGEACKNAIVFCNRKTDVDIVAKSLKKYGYDAAPIHGDLEQSQRTRTLDLFREGGLRFLVASDVAARGLDVPAVSHVFQFDVPTHSEDYVHRIGRTGRAGRSGKAIMFATPAEGKYLDAIEKLLERTIPRAEGQAMVSEDSAPDAPAEASDDAPKPRRTRGGRGRSRKADAEGQGSEQAPAAAPTPAPAEAEAMPETAAEPAPEAKTADAPAPRSEDKPRRGQRQDNRRNDRDAVVGMGDHLPSFIALSLDERRAG